MADIQTEATRVNSGNTLIRNRQIGMESIARLKSVKAQLIALREEVNTDPIYTQEDVDAVQAVIAELTAELATI